MNLMSISLSLARASYPVVANGHSLMHILHPLCVCARDEAGVVVTVLSRK